MLYILLQRWAAVPGGAAQGGDISAPRTTRKETQTLDEDLRAHIPRDRRKAIATGQPIPERVKGSALFADISGFTPLTEALALDLGPRRGAEELAANLNRIFEAVINDLYAYDGEVLYFSGDAVTCWIAGDDGTRAAAVGLQMHKTISEIGVISTPGGTTVPLALKVGVAAGEASRFVIGDPDIQLIDVLAGGVIDKLAAAEQIARKGEVVVEESALRALGDRLTLAERRFSRDTATSGAVIKEVPVDVTRTALPDQLEPIAREVARQWVLPTVAARLEAGGGVFLGELRTAYPMFVHFDGFDYDGDREAGAKLDAFVRRVQQILAQYGGSLMQLTLGDKGAYLFAMFGSPITHEDDAVRAAAAAFELLDLEGSTHARDIRIGIAGGRLFSGTYGHPLRRAFTCLGDPVNLAARLMGIAPPAGAVASVEVVRSTEDRFAWEDLGVTPLKGKREPVEVARLRERRYRPVERHLRYPLPMVGRDRELGMIRSRLEATSRGERSILGLKAEAGMGKSRLLAQAIKYMQASDLRVALGQAEAFGANTTYLAWRQVWRTLLTLDHQLSDDGQVEKLKRRLGEIEPMFVQRAPLLGGLLGLDIPDSAVTASFDAKLRKTSLESLLAAVLRAEAKKRHLVIILEDLHWIDGPSFDLLEVLTRETDRLPVLFLVAYRPEIDPDFRGRLELLPSFEELALDRLERDMVEQVIRAKLGQQFGGDLAVADELIEVIASRSGGNPFYVEELVNFIRSQEVDLSDPRSIRDLELPESLHALVLSRVDSLESAPRAALKVASVVGREFDPPTLEGVYPDLGTLEEIRTQLEKLRQADLVTPDRKEDESWIFRHAITRDAAYESIAFSTRSMLHESAGMYFESGDAAELQLDLLAHHYWHSDNAEKKVEYQRRAGKAAKAAYANSAAIEYFERLAPLLDAGERPPVLVDLGEVLELAGDWGRAEEVEKEALALAQSASDVGQIAWCETALAEVARKQGRYDEASERLDRALTGFQEARDLAGEGRFFHLAGTIAAQQGDLESARTRYEMSLRIRKELDDRSAMASLLSNLGIVAAQSGNLDESYEFHARALDLRSAIGDRWSIGVSKMNLGMNAMRRDHHEEARELFSEARSLGLEVGDSWMVALSEHNLANANRSIGDLAAARQHYARSVEAFSTYGDRWALALLFEDIAMLAAREGEGLPALELVGAADRLRAELETPRAPSLEEQLVDRAIEVDPDLTEEQRSEARRRGMDMELSDAVSLAVACCLF